MLKNVETEKALELVSTCLGAIASPEPGPIDETMRMWSRQGIFVSILEPGAGAFRELVRLIEKTGRIDGDVKVKDVLSRKYIATEVEELIGEAVVTAAEREQEAAELTEDQTRSVWTEWLRRFETPSDVITHYTLVGGLLLDEPIQIGTLTLRPFDDATRKLVFSELGLGTGGSAERQKWTQARRESIQREFAAHEGDAVAHGTVEGAEPIRARELFEERVREALHVISFFRPFVWGVGAQVVIDLSGHVPLGGILQLSVTADGRVSVGGRRSALPFTVTSERWQKMRMMGLSFVSDMLSKPERDRSNLEAMCINAIVWVSRGLQDNVADSRFLKLCIGMESLLLKREEYPYGKTMGERLAFLLGKSGEPRQRISEHLKRIYKVRSDIAHSGRSGKLNDQLGPAQFFATQGVRLFVQRWSEGCWDSMDGFVNWCDDLKWR